MRWRLEKHKWIRPSYFQSRPFDGMSDDPVKCGQIYIRVWRCGFFSIIWQRKLWDYEKTNLGFYH